LFGSKRGLITLAAFACIWFVIYYYIISSASNFVTSDTFKDIIHQAFGQLNLLKVLEWQLPQLSIYWLIAAYILPVFALSFSSDQTCSDRERGTLRFILLRCTRTELLLGRFIGQVLIMCALTAITLLVSILLGVFDGIEASGQLMATALKVFGHLVLIVLPFIASMTLINSFVKSAKMSIVIYILLYILGGLLINMIGYFIVDVSGLFYLYPGEQIDRVLGFEAKVFDQYLLPLIQTVMYLIVANILIKRASL
jgi:ABC-type transport system involved in multi-copper enzyme maturation permease subunit